MKVKGLLHFASSPYARRPELLVWKARNRLVGEPRLAWSPSRVAYVEPSGLKRTIVDWLAKLTLAGDPLPPTQIFGREWAESDLLSLCRNGPSTAGGLASDVKLIWEYGRSHSLPQAAAVAGRNGTIAVEAERQARWIRQWIENNPFSDGIAWSCAMDVAIRAVNWMCADMLLGGALRRAIGEQAWGDWLWNHGRCIVHRLEARLISSNHYLVDLLGLAWLGAAFRESKTAREWTRLAGDELSHVLQSQVRRDGGAYEASIPYHGLYAESALLTLGAIEPSHAEKAISRVKDLVATCAALRRQTGDWWRIGDDDSGRIIRWDPLVQEARADQILALARVIFGDHFVDTWCPHRLFPESGWCSLSRGGWRACVSFGGVGFRGWGGHAHNDRLSVCVDDLDQPVLVDPGTFVYSADPAARNRYRATGSHNTMMIDGREQRDLPPPDRENLFILRGSDRPARVIRCEADSIELLDRLPARNGAVTVRRAVEVRENGITIFDRIEGKGAHEILWFFHLDPRAAVENAQGGWLIFIGARQYLFRAPPAVQLAVEKGRVSREYGVEESATTLTAIWRGSLPINAEWMLLRDKGPSGAG